MMKTIFKVFAVGIVLIIIAIAGFVYTFDPNKYKEEITDVAEAVTGRSIRIAGDMGISLYPWIGVKIHDVSIENPAGFSNKPFATIGQFDVSIEILPLLEKRLVIDKLVLHHLDVGLEKNLDGENNWTRASDVAHSDTVGSNFGLAGLSIGGIEITDSKFGWLEKTTGKHFKISKMNVSTQAFSTGESLPVEVKAYVQSNQPEWQGAIHATAKLDFSDNMAVFDANDLKLAVKALLPSQQIEKIAFALASDSTVNLEAQTAKLKNARLSAFDLIMNGEFDVENIFSVPVIQGPLKIRTFDAAALAKHFKVDLPQMVNAQSLKAISLQTLLKTDFNTVYLDKLSAIVGRSRMKGSVSVTLAAEPLIQFVLKADTINVDDYRIVANESGSNEAPLLLDFIRATHLDGVLDVETVKLDDTEIKHFHVTSNIENGILRANPILMRLNEGEVKAAIQFDVLKTPAAILVAKVNKVDAASTINPLLTKMLGDETVKLDGLVNADVDLKASGASMTTMKKTAQGTIKLTMENAIVEGIDFDNASRSVVVDYAKRNDFRVSKKFISEYVPGNKTAFDGLDATFRLVNGKWVNNDLSLVSDLVNVTGTGNIDIINGEIDYRPVIDMNVRKTVNIRDKLRDHPMEYHVKGSFGGLRTNFDADKYDLWVGRLMIHEAKANRNRRINSQSADSWENVLSK
jgi:AsmA protein